MGPDPAGLGESQAATSATPRVVADDAFPAFKSTRSGETPTSTTAAPPPTDAGRACRRRRRRRGGTISSTFTCRCGVCRRPAGVSSRADRERPTVTPRLRTCDVFFPARHPWRLSSAEDSRGRCREARLLPPTDSNHRSPSEVRRSGGRRRPLFGSMRSRILDDSRGSGSWIL